MKTNSKRVIFILFVLLLSVITEINSQNLKSLKFDSFYADCENKYVIMPSKNDSTKYLIGFIYLDQMAGFTLNAEMNVFTNEKGQFKSVDNSPTTTTLKLRLGKNTRPLALLPEELKAKLKLKDEPDWLGIYKIADPVMHDITCASHLNGQGYFERAALLLEKQRIHHPHAENLEFELGYSYNALRQYDKAINLLEGAIRVSENNAFLYKELGFAYQQKGLYENAVSGLEKGISVATVSQKTIKAEMAFNIAFTYKLFLNNEQEFQNWGAKAYSWSSETSATAKALKKIGLQIIEAADTAYLDVNNNIVFNDKVLEELVRNKLSIKAPIPINISNVENLTSLNISGDFNDKSSPKIKNIDALKYFKNLHMFVARFHLINDLNPLRNLVKMKILLLQNNDISNIEPLSKLTNLENLELYRNNVSDLSPLKNHTGLKNLNLFQNNVFDINALEHLTELKSLNLGNNHVSDLTPLLKLSKLEYLWLSYNPVKNVEAITLLGNTLKTLQLAKCNLKDISFLKNFTKLETLLIFDNPIEDLSPIKQLNSLQNLSVSNCLIKDISVIVALTKNNAFQNQKQKFQYQLDLSGNPIDYNDSKIKEDKEYLMQMIPKSKF